MLPLKKDHKCQTYLSFYVDYYMISTFVLLMKMSPSLSNDTTRGVMFSELVLCHEHCGNPHQCLLASELMNNS